MGPNGLYVSSNDGDTWTPAGNGIGDYESVSKMAVSGSKIIASGYYLYQTTRRWADLVGDRQLSCQRYDARS